MSEVRKWYIGAYNGEAEARTCSPSKLEIIHQGDGRYFVLDEDSDRVTADRDAALGQELALERDIENWKRKACESADREHELQQRLIAADERADVLGAAVALLIKVTPRNKSSFADKRAAMEILAAFKPAEAVPDFRMIGTEKMQPMEYDEP